jgi:hypothetical protein
VDGSAISVATTILEPITPPPIHAGTVETTSSAPIAPSSIVAETSTPSDRAHATTTRSTLFTSM